MFKTRRAIRIVNTPSVTCANAAGPVHAARRVCVGDCQARGRGKGALVGLEKVAPRLIQAGLPRPTCASARVVAVASRWAPWGDRCAAKTVVESPDSAF